MSYPTEFTSSDLKNLTNIFWGNLLGGLETLELIANFNRNKHWNLTKETCGPELRNRQWLDPEKHAHHARAFFVCFC